MAWFLNINKWFININKSFIYFNKSFIDIMKCSFCPLWPSIWIRQTVQLSVPKYIEPIITSAQNGSFGILYSESLFD